MKRFINITFSLFVCLMASSAMASGFMVPELSASAMGKGSAVMTDSDDPAMIWYNAGSQAFLPSASFSGVALFALGHTDFEPAGGGPVQATVDKLFVLPRLFADFEVAPWMHAGIGVYTAYGMGVRYEDDWIGRVNGIKSEMSTLSFNPSLSFKVHPRLGIGLGFVAMKAGAELVNGLPEAVGGTVKFGGEGWAFGGNAGITFKAIPDVLDVGLSYRSRLLLPLEGRVDFDPSPDFARVLLDQPAKTEITTPDYITAGLGFNVTPRVRIGLDANFILWSLYDELVLELDDGQNLASKYGYENSFIIRIGVDWQPEFAEGLALRGGFIYDDNPAHEGAVGPTMPDADKLNFTAGLGYTWRWLRADASYMLNYYLPNEVSGATTTPDGTYKTLAHMIAVGITVSFDSDSGCDKEVVAETPVE